MRLFPFRTAGACVSSRHASISGSADRSMRPFPARTAEACVHFRFGWPGHASISDSADRRSISDSADRSMRPLGWPGHASIPGSDDRSMRPFPVRTAEACVHFRFGWPGHASIPGSDGRSMRPFPVRLGVFPVSDGKTGACVHFRFSDGGPTWRFQHASISGSAGAAASERGARRAGPAGPCDTLAPDCRLRPRQTPGRRRGRRPRVRDRRRSRTRGGRSPGERGARSRNLHREPVPEQDRELGARLGPEALRPFPQRR